MTKPKYPRVDMEEYIRNLVDAAPPLTNEQIFKLRMIFKASTTDGQSGREQKAIGS
jgi:hypothetical protein